MIRYAKFKFSKKSVFFFSRYTFSHIAEHSLGNATLNNGYHGLFTWRGGGFSGWGVKLTSSFSQWRSEMHAAKPPFSMCPHDAVFKHRDYYVG